MHKEKFKHTRILMIFTLSFCLILLSITGCSGEINNAFFDNSIIQSFRENDSFISAALQITESAQIIEERTSWIIGAIIMSLLVIVLLLIIFIKSKNEALKFKKEHERVRIMLDTLPIACFIGSANGKIFDCNTEAVRLFELKDKQEFIDHFDKDLSPEYQPCGQSSYELLFIRGIETVEKGKSIFNWTHQLLDGTPIPALVTLESVVYGGEKVLMAYIRDMREHTKMTNEINRQNELLFTSNNVSSILLEPNISHFEDTLNKAMGIMAETSSVDRICIWKNSKENNWLRFFLAYQWDKTGFKSHAKDGVLVPDVWLTDHPAWNEALSKGECINSLVRDMTPSEQSELLPRNIMAVLVVPVFLQDQLWGFLGFDRCNAEQVLAESDVLIMRSASRMLANAVIRNEMADELVFAKEQAEKSNRSKTIFLSHMSHEIRTPMNAILGIAEIQLRDENISPESMEAFAKIYESGDLLLNIINDILDLSKIESGILELTLIRYDIPSLINDTVQLNRLRYDSKPIEFSLHIDENTPVDLLGDELRIKQVLNNILSNAYKYTDKGRIDFSIKPEYPENSTEDDVTLVFCISDTGQGLNEEQMKRIFTEYSRFNLVKNRTIVGAGLGLSITKRLIDLMDGVIEVKSEPDKGSTFTIRIPQKRIGTAVCGNELTKKLQNFHFQTSTIIKKTRFLREYMPYGSVLVVDDVDSNVYVAKGMLLPYGLKIETASSGFAAIDKIKSGSVYDIVFMDHMMPKMDGIETVKKLREMEYKNPIIALTANAIVGREEMFLKNGFDGFISKPIDSRELNLFLNDFIRNKKPPEVVEAARREQNEKNPVDADIKTSDITKSQEMAKLFTIDAENAINILEGLSEKIQNPGKDDLDAYIITVHGMKSTLANIGEKELSGIALKLELAGEDRNLNELTKTTPVFIDSLKTIIAKYKTEKKNDIEISDDDLNYLHEKLNNIKKACETFNKNKAKAVLNELKQKTWTADINAVIDETVINILHSKFKDNIAIIDNYLKSE
ncbi:MAG: ATP-binding protein [Treponema sp.]|nr:ATP-binding protein [Treponema sp.]